MAAYKNTKLITFIIIVIGVISVLAILFVVGKTLPTRVESSQSNQLEIFCGEDIKELEIALYNKATQTSAISLQDGNQSEAPSLTRKSMSLISNIADHGKNSIIVTDKYGVFYALKCDDQCTQNEIFMSYGACKDRSTCAFSAVVSQGKIYPSPNSRRYKEHICYGIWEG